MSMFSYLLYKIKVNESDFYVHTVGHRMPSL